MVNEDINNNFQEVVVKSRGRSFG